MIAFGNIEGSTAEKLRQTRAYVAEFIDNAGCHISDDGAEIIVRAKRFDGEWFEERLGVALLPVEAIRHAVMRLGRRTRSPEMVSDWKRWAAAWQLMKVYGNQALDHAASQVNRLRDEAELGGVALWQDIGHRIAVLLSDPAAWAGRS